MKTQPRIWRTFKRHPMSAAYPDISGGDWTQFVDDLKEHGILNRRKVVLHDNQVLDGWQFYRACIEADVKPEFDTLPRGVKPEDYIRIVQDNRRHESQETRMARAQTRRERVVQARQEGQSLPAIAAQEGVAVATVQRDLEKAGSTLPGGKVEPEDGKVTGLDGRQQPASRPVEKPEPLIVAPLQRMIDDGAISPKLVPEIARLDNNQQVVMLEAIQGGANPRLALSKVQAAPRQPGEEGPHRNGSKNDGPKNGAVVFDQRAWDAIYGSVLRQVDAVAKPYKAENSPRARELRDEFTQWAERFHEWRKSFATTRRK